MSISCPLKIGVACRIVNPSNPVVAVGHRGTQRYRDVHSDLCVQAMVVEDAAGTKMVLAGWDTCVVHGILADRVKSAICQFLSVDPRAICINASHTHSAPPLSTDLLPSTKYFDPEYAAFFEEQAIGVVEDAMSHIEPVSIRYAESSCPSIGINRRMMVDDEVQMRPNPHGPVDHRVQVISAQSPKQDTPIAIVVKYACHPVTVGARGLGSDYPGFMREYIESRYPGATAMFLQGCGGDVRIQSMNEQGTAFADHDVVQQARRFGRDLGMSVETALSKEGAIISGPISYKYKDIMLPVRLLPETEYRKSLNAEEQNFWGRQFCSMLDSAESLPAEVSYRMQLFRFKREDGKSFYMTGLEGEVFTEYAFKVADILHDPQAVVLGLCNDYHGYVPTRENLFKGGYEVEHAYRLMPYLPGPYRPEIESILLRELAALAEA